MTQELSESMQGASHIQPVQKVKRKRTTTGCITCRIRRVKCDEAKPSCKRCTSTGRKCDGYAPLKPKVPKDTTFRPSDSDDSTIESSGIRIPRPTGPPCANHTICAGRSRQSFYFFRQTHEPMLSSYGTSGFWDCVVLQASNASESIKHLVIAASTLRSSQTRSNDSIAGNNDAGQTMDTSTSGSSSSNVAFGLHYGRALHVLSSTGQADTVVVLVACVLLAVCDELQGRDNGAMQHILAGQRILSAQKDTTLRAWEDTLVLRELTSTFSRLCTPRPAMHSCLPLTEAGW